MTTAGLDTTKQASASDIIREMIKGLPEELQDNFKAILQDEATSVQGLIDCNDQVITKWKGLIVAVKSNPVLAPLCVVMLKYFPVLQLTEEEEIAILNEGFISIPRISQGETLIDFMAYFSYTPEQKANFTGKFLPILFAHLDDKVELLKVYIPMLAMSKLNSQDPRIIPGSIKLLGRALGIENLNAEQKDYIEEGIRLYTKQLQG